MEAETERRMGEKMTDIYDKIKGHAVTQSDAEKELNDIAVAIGSNRFLDPPDGGSVSLAEQVTRMRQALEKAEAAQSDTEPDTDRIAELEREIYTLRANLVECADTLSAQQFNQAQQKRIEACRAELAALVQSDTEPAAWLLKSDDGRLTAFTTTNEDHARDYSQKHPHYSVFPLYTAPPRPDASAGLAKENAELRKQLNEWLEWDADSDRVPRPPNEIRTQPDISAGLIEASCLLDKRADEYTGYNEKIEQGYRMAAKYLRSRAWLAAPSVQWRHVDGPLLSWAGQLHWLTIRERLSLMVGASTLEDIAESHWPLRKQFRRAADRSTK